MPVFSQNEIRKIATNEQTFARGYNYHAHNLVRELAYDPQRRCISAVVAGARHYQVNIKLDAHEHIAGYSCTCPAFFDYNGACKHIIAVLLNYGIPNLPENQPAAPPDAKDAARLAASRALIAALLSQSPTHAQTRLKLQVTLHKGYSVASPAQLELHLGLNRLYVVKKIRELLEAIEHQHDLYFGQSFTFQPGDQTFYPEDQPLIDLLLELYRDERNIWNYRSRFEGNRFELKPSQFRRFLSFAGAMRRAYWKPAPDRPRRRIVVTSEIPPLLLQVVQGLQYVEAQFENPEAWTFLTTAHDVIVARDQFYLLTPPLARLLTKLWEAVWNSPDHRLLLADPEAITFLGQVAPLVREFCQVEVAPTVRERIRHESLTIALYLERLDRSIALQPRLRYGATEINPLLGATPGLSNGQLLFRDTQAEADLTQEITAAGFTLKDHCWVLRDDELIYRFLSEILPVWTGVYQIFRSDNFDKLRIKHAPRLCGAVRLQETTDLLEISIGTDTSELPPHELAAFWAAIREKKKYYRLKNGDFVNLTSPETQSAGKLLARLGLTGADFRKGQLLIPKYRAFYLDQAFRDYDSKRFNLDAAFTHLVRTVKNPQAIAATLPAEFEQIMRDYQKTGFKWLKALSTSGFGGILADDMGLGKTLQIIAWVQSEYDRCPLPSLVIAPTSLVYNWREEAAKFAPKLPVLVLDGSKEERLRRLADAGGYALLITSYPLIRRDIEAIQSLQFNCCVLDEAQHIKNPATISAKTVKQIHARHHFAVTGTPIENSLTELWSIFDFIMPDYLYSHHKFQTRFEAPIVRRGDPEALADLGRHIKPFILRRLKTDVLTELPEKIETKISCEMTEGQKKAYLAYLARARQELETELETQGFQKSQIKILALITRLRQICCHPALFLDHYHSGSGKLELLLELIRDSRPGGHRILIFSQFVAMLDLIAAALDGEAVPYARIDGQTPPRERLQLVKNFNDGQKEVFLISLKAGGTGLNLTGADTVVHYDPWWNPAVEDQATDRAYRIGQQKVVQVFKLVTKETIEAKIYALQTKKKALIDSVIKPGENFLGKMTVAEIRELFAE
jgi:superfamily II DNA or RNA helicase